MGTSDGEVLTPSTAPVVYMPTVVRTSQPQSLVGVNKANRITSGMVGLLDSVTCTDIVTGSRYASVGRIPTKQGIGHGSVGGSTLTDGLYSNRIGTDPNTNWRPTSPILTLVTLFDYFGHSTAANIAGVGFGTGGDGFYIYTNYSDGTPVATIRSGSSIVSYGVAGHLVVGSSNIIALSYDGTTQSMYLNGKLIYSQLVTIPSFTAYDPTYTRTVLCAENGEFTGANVSVQFAAIWNRALSNAEQVSLAANPWQIFKAPASRNVWVNTP